MTTYRQRLLVALNFLWVGLAAARPPAFWLPLLGVGVLLWMALVNTLNSKRGGTQFVVLRGRISCPECQYLLDLDDRYCARCGQSVSQVKKRIHCPGCRGRNWEDDKFCRQCGTSMEPTTTNSGP